MGILKWDKPQPVRAKMKLEQLHPEHPGDYIPNMSEEDKHAWKAKLVGHKSGDPRVEIRKTTDGGHHASDGFRTVGWPTEREVPVIEGVAQVLMVVWPDGSVRLSMNSKAEFSMEELTAAVSEALDFLHAYIREAAVQAAKPAPITLKWQRLYRVKHHDYFYQTTYGKNWIINVQHHPDGGWQWAILRRERPGRPVVNHTECDAPCRSLQAAKTEAKDCLERLINSTEEHHGQAVAGLCGAPTDGLLCGAECPGTEGAVPEHGEDPTPPASP